MLAPPAHALYLVRHGETDWNAEARLQGQQDVPLNAMGRAQAEEAGRRLKALVPDPASLDALASPLARARETMELMRRAAGLDPQAYRTDDRLKELSFGRWEGLTWKELRRRDPRGAAARSRDKWGTVPPGGESYAMLAERVAPVLSGIARETVIVSHGGVARVVLGLFGFLPREQAPALDVWQGRVLVIERGGWRWH